MNVQSLLFSALTGSSVAAYRVGHTGGAASMRGSARHGAAGSTVQKSADGGRYGPDRFSISPEAEAAIGEQDRNPTGSLQLELSDEERAVVEELKQTDMRVRAHEQAHLAAAGGNAKSGASYTYQTGPDGQAYAVGGEVSIDMSSVPGDPEATAAKARQVRAAALAPADPSPQDLKVAAAASQLEQRALAEAREASNAPESSATAPHRGNGAAASDRQTDASTAMHPSSGHAAQAFLANSLLASRTKSATGRFSATA